MVGSRMSITDDYVASWSADFIVALSLPDVSTASRPVPKSRMINFPMQVARPITTKPIITMIPMPSQLSDVENMAVPQGATTDLYDCTPYRRRKKILVPDSLCVDRQSGDEEDRQSAEERGCEREWTVPLKLRSPSPREPHETKCHE